MTFQIVIPSYEDIVPPGGQLGLSKGVTLGGIITNLLPHLFILAGILMLLMILWGGIHLMIAQGDPEGIREGKAKVMYGIIGFFVVFVSYFVVQIIEQVFKIPIL